MQDGHNRLAYESDFLIWPLACGRKSRKKAAYQPLLMPAKPVLRYLKMKGLPPFIASRESLLRFFDSLHPPAKQGDAYLPTHLPAFQPHDESREALIQSSYCDNESAFCPARKETAQNSGAFSNSSQAAGRRKPPPAQYPNESAVP